VPRLCPIQIHTGLFEALLPSLVKLAPGAMELPDTSALGPKPRAKVPLTRAAAWRATQWHRSLLQHNFRALPPLWDLPHPVRWDSASPVARGLAEPQRSLDLHSHTRWARGFELEGACASLTLYARCTATPSLAPAEG